jgi:hypothetical protein
VNAPVKRTAVRHLTYRGDHQHAVGRVMGPNAMQEYLVVVDAAYDQVAGKTVLGLAYIPLAEVVGGTEVDEHGQRWLRKEAAAW